VKRIPEQSGVLIFGLFFLTVSLILFSWSHELRESAATQAQAQISATDQTSTNPINTKPISQSSPSIDYSLQQAELAVSEDRLAHASDLNSDILTEGNPNSETTSDSLLAFDKRHSLPTTHKKADSVRYDLGHQFKPYLTKHFIILSDADANWIRAQGGRLERTHHQFYRVTQKLGLNPLPLTERLLCIVFNNHADFVQFAAKHNEGQAQWVAGYYSPKPNYVVFYNTATSPSFQSAWETLEQWEDRLSDTQSAWREAQRTRQTDRASQLRQQSQQLKESINKEIARLHRLSDSVVTVKTVHEATHQLAFNTNIQSRTREYPFWMTEGFAVCMETDRTSAAFGPEYRYEIRQKRFDELLDKGHLLSLAQLITLTSVPENDQQQADIMYHQSYALFTWLYRFRREALGQYMLALNETNAAHSNADLFAKHFGDPAEVERDWLRWERSR